MKIWHASVALLAFSGCDCRRDAGKGKPPAEIASSLLGDLSPLDSASATPIVGRQDPWDPAYCEPQPEKERRASFSELAVTGTCNFEYHDAAVCNARGDDFYAVVRRRLADGNELELYINVEYYTGPGTYDRKVEFLALLRRGTSLYRWSNNQATVTLGTGQGGLSTSDKMAEQAQGGVPTALQLAPTTLNAEPGTPARGAMTLTGSIGCVMKKPPK
jgi:hypothetical protein